MEDEQFIGDLQVLQDHLAYLLLMASLVPGADFEKMKQIVDPLYDFINKEKREIVEERLPYLLEKIKPMTEAFFTKFPLKRNVHTVVEEFNNLTRSSADVNNYGLDLGWLNLQMSLENLHLYKDAPYHFKLGLGTHKGNASIEEDFLLKDAFNVRVRAEYYHELLVDFGNTVKDIETKTGKNQFSQELYQQIAEVKFEVSALSRLTIVSFYAFIESFVNSVGYNYLKTTSTLLSEEERESLMGTKSGRYLQLKTKIEKFQKLIRADKKVVIVLSDDRQIPEDFMRFFEYYEQLRNAAVHYSPSKEKIWMKPDDWLTRAFEFSELSMKVALKFWTACYPSSDGPEYLGKLDQASLLNRARKRLERIRTFENKRTKWHLDESN